MCCCLISLTACDKPEISVKEKNHIIKAEGGELVVAVYSTGVSKVEIPKDAQWVVHKETVETRALLSYDEDVLFTISPNEGKKSRIAEVKIFSFGKNEKIRIMQEGVK